MTIKENIIKALKELDMPYAEGSDKNYDFYVDSPLGRIAYQKEDGKIVYANFYDIKSEVDEALIYKSVNEYNHYSFLTKMVYAVGEDNYFSFDENGNSTHPRTVILEANLIMVNEDNISTILTSLLSELSSKHLFNIMNPIIDIN